MNLHSITNPNLDGNLYPIFDARLRSCYVRKTIESPKEEASIPVSSSFSTTEKPKKTCVTFKFLGKTLFSYLMMKEYSVCCIQENKKLTDKNALDPLSSSLSSSDSSPTIEKPRTFSSSGSSHVIPEKPLSMMRKRKKSGQTIREQELVSSSSSSNTGIEKSKGTRVTFKFRGDMLFSYQTNTDHMIKPMIKSPTHKEESGRAIKRIKTKEFQHYKADPSSSSSSLTVDKPKKTRVTLKFMGNTLLSVQSSDSDNSDILFHEGLP